MLVIRPAQVRVLEVTASSRFEDEMVAHGRAFSPQLAEVLGDIQLRLAVRQTLDRGSGYNLMLRGPLRLCVEMMFLFGSGFDTDPQYSWAGAILRGDGGGMERAGRLHRAVLNYQRQVSRPGSVNTMNALRELAVLTRQPDRIPLASSDGWMLKEMHRIFPRKMEFLGEEPVMALLREAKATAQRHHLPIPRGEIVLGILMFSFGHGCAADALYPWISRTLTDERISGPAARMERLENKAMTWLDRVLANLYDSEAA